MAVDQRMTALKYTVRLLRTKRSPHVRLPFALSYSTESSAERRTEYLVDGNVKDSFLGQQSESMKNSSRKNELNIQMLSHLLYRQIFCYNAAEPNQPESDINNEGIILKARNELKKHGLWSDDVQFLPDVTLKLPKLEGKNIEEHFWQIGLQQAEPYKKLLDQFVEAGIPEAPQQWLRQAGWTRYKAGEEPLMVPIPDEDALVLDVEVCMKIGKAPTLAVAVSADAWYGWVSPSLAEEENPISANHYSPNMLIPLEDGTKKNRPRIVVGHNVSYDRARIKEQYNIDCSALRFIDTMSLHISVGGLCSVQKSKLREEARGEDEETWKASSMFCLSSLKDLYSLYCQSELAKEERNYFVQGSLSDIRENFQKLMTYCSGDVKATFEVLRVLFPIFLERFPHPVTLAGMLEMGMAYLTVGKNWERYLQEAEHKYEDLESEVNFLLAKKCDNACELMHGERYKNDLWMWNEDWSTQDLKLTKKAISVDNKTLEIEESDEDEEYVRLIKKFAHLFRLGSVLPLNKPRLPGYPAWYRKLCAKPDSPDWRPGPQSLSTSLTITPKLLNLTFDGYPLHYIRELGWGILVPDLKAKNPVTKIPFQKLKEITMRKSNTVGRKGFPNYEGTAVLTDKKIDGCCYFLKLPHRDGRSNNVGQPLSKSFNSTMYSENLSGSDAVAEKGLAIGNLLLYWRNNRERITGQMVVWQNDNVGVIIPQIIVCGTLTRRAVESTWLTASKATSDRLGSELRAMVQAPPGYHFVGADVDSQELWIASLIGDSNSSKLHGGTPFGWMTLSGTKLKGTDLHSITAKAAGISRDHAKVINYARIYGAGVYFAQRLLQNYNPSMSPEEVKSKVHIMYSMTKGKKLFKLREDFLREHKISNVNITDVSSAISFASRYGKPVEAVFDRCEWEGGTESAVFNELERIANSPRPQTPFLGSRLSRAIEPRHSGDGLYLNTRINWVVQSGAVDFLHLMLVCMRWLTCGRIRFCLSFHDEVRYLVPTEDRYQAALALQITNLLTRSFFAHRMGLYDLPQSVAFFSAVEVDKCLRKEADDDCVTPSNPHGLKNGYGIPKGESLNIYQTIQKAGGVISAFGKQDK